LLNLAADDDDGNEANKAEPVKKQPVSATKQFFDKYFEDLTKAKTLDDYNLAIVSNKEKLMAALATYKPDVRLATEAEVAKREQAAKVRVGEARS
jgi:hypothetical protein